MLTTKNIIYIIYIRKELIELKEKSDILIKNVNTEIKRKAMFVLKSKGKTLTQAVRDMCDKLASEFDEKN